MSEQRPKTQLHKIFRLTRGVIFLATPHYGTDLVQCIIPVDSAGIIKENSEILRVLRPESKTLTEIRESFLTMLVAQNKNGQMPLQVHCYYAKQLLQGVERVQPYQSLVFLHADVLSSRFFHCIRRDFAVI